MRESTQIRAMDDYFHALLLEEEAVSEAAFAEPVVQLQPVVSRREEARPYLEEPQRLERLSELLAQVGQVHDEMAAISAPQVEALTIEADVITLPQVEALAEVVSEPLVETVIPEVETVVTTEVATQTELAVEPEPSPEEWRNIELGNEFQALFFDVAGVTFAVPLTELGGIHKLGDITSLFGQAPWFRGIMTQREQKLKVVDTAQWVMPDSSHVDMPPYHYLITLGDSSWGLCCHHLKGTERLRQDQVKWRNQEGKRPWLAGMVKEKKCALLHVQELLRLLERGVNIEGR